jgi:hypothetical protein
MLTLGFFYGEEEIQIEITSLSDLKLECKLDLLSRVLFKQDTILLKKVENAC